MKEFSHPGTTEKAAIDINRAIESTITVARNEWKYVAEMVVDFDPAMPLIFCLPGEFNQVTLNMIINAAHAISETLAGDRERKGTIAISTRNLGGPCGDPHLGYRERNPRGNPIQDLRSVLHDQGGRQGNRPGAGHCPFGDRRQAWRNHWFRNGTGKGNDFHRPPADCEPGGIER